MPDPSRPAEEVEVPLRELAADVRRLAERLRTLSEARFAAPAPPYPSRAAAARHAVQALADAAQTLEEGADEEPNWREVAHLSVFALGDMVAVTGSDVLAAAATAPEQVWTRHGRAPTAAVIRDTARLLADVRRAV